MITGLDLVEWQLKIAAGESLPFHQSDLAIHGHAIEARLYAEDPKNNFLPSIGTITYLQCPRLSSGIRLDSGIVSGDTVTPHYDPMLAKLIAWGDDRNMAHRRLNQALKDYHLVGCQTNIAYLRHILNHTAFIDAQLSTHFIQNHLHRMLDIDLERIFMQAALFLTCYFQNDHVSMPQLKLQTHAVGPWEQKDAFQMNLPSVYTLQLRCHNDERQITLQPDGFGYQVVLNQQGEKTNRHFIQGTLDTHREPDRLFGELDGLFFSVQGILEEKRLFLLSDENYTIDFGSPLTEKTARGSAASLKSPCPVLSLQHQRKKGCSLNQEPRS